MMIYIRRLFALPFFMFFTIMHWATLWIYSLWLFMKHGGEWIQYDKEFNKETIHSIVREGVRASNNISKTPPNMCNKKTDTDIMDSGVGIDRTAEWV